MLELSLDTTVDITTSAIRHGAGLFETIRIQGGMPCHLELHLERLASGCAFLGLEAPPKASQVRDFLLVHGVGIDLDYGALRLVAVDGKLFLFANYLPPRSPHPVTLGHSQGTIRFSGNPLNRFKTLSYLENHRLAKEAHERGLFEVIALNERNALTDGGRTSLFASISGQVFTPPVSDGALPGIARRVLLEGGWAEEATLRWEDLARADGVFLANALRGIIPVSEIEGHGTRIPEHPFLIKAAQLLEEK